MDVTSIDCRWNYCTSLCHIFFYNQEPKLSSVFRFVHEWIRINKIKNMQSVYKCWRALALFNHGTLISSLIPNPSLRHILSFISSFHLVLIHAPPRGSTLVHAYMHFIRAITHSQPLLVAALFSVHCASSEKKPLQRKIPSRARTICSCGFHLKI